MGSGSTGLEARLRSFLQSVQSEFGVLDRVVYKHKNQHRRCPYFQSLLKVRRDVRLLLSARLGEILNNLFPIIIGKRPAHKAYIPSRMKKNSSSGKYNYLERLLGVARLLSQMAEPILKTATQISLLLAKSFFTTFSVTILALLARLRVLVQQMLLDVVIVFNEVASLSQKKHSVKLINEGIEVYREYYPSSRDVPMLECLWEEDKFVLLERTDHANADNEEAQEALSLEPSIQYESIELFNEVQSSEHELSSEQRHGDFPFQDSTTHHESNVNSLNIIKNPDSGNHSVDQKFAAMEQASGSMPVDAQAKIKTKSGFCPSKKIYTL